MFRNTPYINRLYEESKGFKLVFTKSKHYCFDECNFQFMKLKEGENILDIHSEVESMTHIVKKLHPNQKIITSVDHWVIEGFPGNMEWNDGHIYYNEKYEAMIYHLIQFKEPLYLQIPHWNEILNHVYIHEFYMSTYNPVYEKGKNETKQCLYNMKKEITDILKYYTTVIPIKLIEQGIQYYSQYIGK